MHICSSAHQFLLSHLGSYRVLDSASNGLKVVRVCMCVCCIGLLGGLINLGNSISLVSCDRLGSEKAVTWQLIADF